jgi:predicted TIM-barrel fold metal-dependent hydrolase
MLDGLPLIDVHQHVVRKSTLKLDWQVWEQSFPETAAALYGQRDEVDPAAFDAYLEAQGVDVAVLLCEYSPKVTGIQPIEDVLPLARHNPARVKVIANVNPHLHYPAEDELQRQLDLGAVACKIHPVHAGAYANDRALYGVYDLCQSAGVPVVVHCGTSTVPGAANKYADPIHLDDVLRDFRRLSVVLAHGGRGWWYDAAAFLALHDPRVWIDLGGLPPARLKAYYAKHNWNRLIRKMIFGTDWPGIPGIGANARAVAELCPDDETRRLVLAGNAAEVYHLKA